MNYQELNNTYKDKLVFRFGDEAGFYSEYNNMLLVMFFCLIDHINFNISSVGNKLHKDGWEHFFKPFCQEYPEEINKKYNRRKVFENDNQEVRDYMTNHDITYFTYHVFNKYRKIRNVSQRFQLSELGLEGYLQDNLRVLNSMIYRFNDFAKKNIDAIIQSTVLPNDYIGLHIRRGDKIRENPHTAIDTYISKLKKQNLSIKNLFIYTDEVSILDELKRKYPEYTYYSIDNTVKTGFNYEEFQNFDETKKDQSLFEMFANVEILANSELTIGTYSTNPGTFLGFYHKKNNFIGVDSNQFTFR